MFLAKKIIGLDILRFLMALIMVTYHVQPLLGKSFFNELSFNGFLATSTFFILSGFILTHVYYKKIQTNTFSNTNFLIKRFSALYPIHIFTLLISILFFFILHFIMKKSFPI
ncbi:OpgC domain-containing protein [Acinetobacter parvus]|nr:OpgC domain-containing protein [Acinetobacter parvus]